MSELLVISHDDCALHDPVPGHPERPERLEAVMKGIRQLDRFAQVQTEPASRDELVAVHDEHYVDRLLDLEHGLGPGDKAVALDADTRVGPGSVRAARLAAGAALRAAELAVARDGHAAFAVVRPPGHHAEVARAMGFCQFNSIAVAAQAALSHPAIRRIAICDFDVHHGNGTEAIFSGRKDVLFASSHQLPLYPGSGDPDRKTPSNILNAALPPGSGSDEFRNAWKAHLFDEIDRFGPDLILISAGFDAHWRDPLAQMQLKDEDYFWIGHQLKLLADANASGRLAASLEGGYDLQALTESALAFAEGITFEH